MDCLRALLGLVALALTIGTFGNQGQASALTLEACEIRGLDSLVQCGTLNVPEDHARPDGRRIDIHFVRVPATGDRPHGAPVFLLAGGPGVAASQLAAPIAHQLRSLEARHDLLLIDQRGVGQSHPIPCDLLENVETINDYLGDFLPVDAIRRCRAQAERTHELTRYATEDFVADLEALRQALGYQAIVPYGISYGSRVALHYLRRHPSNTHAVVIFGAVPPDAFPPLDIAANAQHGLDAVLEGCRADAECARRFPESAARTERFFTRLRSQPVAVETLDPATGVPVTVRFDADLAAEGLRYLLYSPPHASLVPAVIDLADRGDYGALAEFVLARRQQGSAARTAGLYLAVTCTEDFNGPGAEEARRRAEGTFVGDYRFRNQQSACAEWPRGDIADDFHQPVTSDRPVLILSGSADPATPPAWGERVAGYLENARHLVIPDAAHSHFGLVNESCYGQVVADFIANPDLAALDVACIDTMRRKGFHLEPLPSGHHTASVADLAILEGRWLMEQFGVEFEMMAGDNHLRAEMPGDETLLLLPVAASRFRAVGLIGFELVIDGGPEEEVVSARFQRPGANAIALRKVKD